ncbi:hypothetical protein GC197_08050 [bacterium]|nr:hypothetical protein [bacterium]
MSRLIAFALVTVLMLGAFNLVVQAQEAQQEPAAEASAETTTAPTTDKVATDNADAENVAEEVPQKLDDLASQVDQSKAAQATTAGILTPLYRMAEALEFPAFHWIAFALMFAGVVGFALQLVIGKLVVFAHMGFSLKEILSDALGLVISLLGLMFTTQAAAQNSTFTQSPFAVLSASVLGLVIGLFLYSWGQSQEVEAVRGRRAAADAKSKQAS